MQAGECCRRYRRHGGQPRRGSDNRRLLNLGVVTGYNGLVVLDFDTRQLYDSWMQLAIALGDEMADVAAHSYRVFTSRGCACVCARSRTSQRVQSTWASGCQSIWWLCACAAEHPSKWLCLPVKRVTRFLVSRVFMTCFPFEPDNKATFEVDSTTNASECSSYQR